MVLNQLKGRLKTARRGHKLLKDKRDELMRQFMDVVKLNKQLRTRVEEGLTGAFASLQVASSIMSPEMLEQALLYPRQSVELGMDFKNIMSVNVPVYSFHTKNNDPSEVYPYGFAQTSGELDDAVRELGDILPDLLRLAEVEKATQLLAAHLVELLGHQHRRELDNMGFDAEVFQNFDNLRPRNGFRPDVDVKHKSVCVKRQRGVNGRGG